LSADAGIAIGPILFIIAILAILAAAIAAGSGNFTGGTTNEGNKTKASAIIQIGENLKAGMDRLMIGNQLAYSSVDTNTQNTSGTNSLFSPAGGGISPPSYSLANNPSTDGTATNGDVWFFPQGVVPGVGTGAGYPDIVATLRVSQGVCSEINNKAASTATPAVNDLGNFTATGNNVITTAAWPAVRAGKLLGCVYNNNASSNGYYFYQILAIQ
jgi:type II secretory pathway pseudopilin PulG